MVRLLHRVAAEQGAQQGLLPLQRPGPAGAVLLGRLCSRLCVPPGRRRAVRAPGRHQGPRHLPAHQRAGHGHPHRPHRLPAHLLAGRLRGARHDGGAAAGARLGHGRRVRRGHGLPVRAGRRGAQGPDRLHWLHQPGRRRGAGHTGGQRGHQPGARGGGAAAVRLARALPGRVCVAGGRRHPALQHAGERGVCHQPRADGLRVRGPPSSSSSAAAAAAAAMWRRRGPGTAGGRPAWRSCGRRCSCSGRQEALRAAVGAVQELLERPGAARVLRGLECGCVPLALQLDAELLCAAGRRVDAPQPVDAAELHGAVHGGGARGRRAERPRAAARQHQHRRGVRVRRRLPAHLHGLPDAQRGGLLAAAGPAPGPRGLGHGGAARHRVAHLPRGRAHQRVQPGAQHRLHRGRRDAAHHHRHPGVHGRRVPGPRRVHDAHGADQRGGVAAAHTVLPRNQPSALTTARRGAGAAVMIASRRKAAVTECVLCGDMRLARAVRSCTA